MSAAEARPARGKLIVIEGIDGTGKTTLAAALAEALSVRGVDVIRSFEPTRGEHGRRLRELATQGRDGVSAEEEAALFIKDRREHVENVIEPALAAGRTVLLDRYFYSTMAYQGARGLDPENLTQNMEFAPLPDWLVLLDLPVADALHRIVQKRGSEPDHFEGADYLSRVRELFLQVRHPNMLKLDARQLTEDLTRAILERIS